MPGSRPIPLPCRLEEQTRRLQKDMKKSTDADLGRWPCPALSRDGRRAEGVALLTQSPGAGFEEGALSSRPTDVPDKCHEATLHSDHHSLLSLQQQPPPAMGGGQLLGLCPRASCQSASMGWGVLAVTSPTLLTPGVSTLCIASHRSEFESVRYLSCGSSFRVTWSPSLFVAPPVFPAGDAVAWASFPSCFPILLRM